MALPEPPTSGHALHREMLLGDALSDMVSRCRAKLPLRTPEERRANLADILSRRPDRGAGVWVFGYGSLIWNPIIHHDEAAPMVLDGWHRAFCLGTPAGRGTPENPGLVLGLAPGGLCEGVAFHVAEADVEAELDLLWRREMLADGYVAQWVTLRGPKDGRRVPAIAFVINEAAMFFARDLPEAEVVRRLATARGELGSSAEYLLHTRDGLAAHGLRDPHIDHLAEQVAAHR